VLGEYGWALSKLERLVGAGLSQEVKSPCDDFNISSDDWEAFKKEKETLEF
jgi:hypothetical protein